MQEHTQIVLVLMPEAKSLWHASGWSGIEVVKTPGDLVEKIGPHFMYVQIEHMQVWHKTVEIPIFISQSFRTRSSLSDDMWWACFGRRVKYAVQASTEISSFKRVRNKERYFAFNGPFCGKQLLDSKAWRRNLSDSSLRRIFDMQISLGRIKETLTHRQFSFEIKVK